MNVSYFFIFLYYCSIFFKTNSIILFRYTYNLYKKLKNVIKISKSWEKSNKNVYFSLLLNLMSILEIPCNSNYIKKLLKKHEVIIEKIMKVNWSLIKKLW